MPADEDANVGKASELVMVEEITGPELMDPVWMGHWQVPTGAEVSGTIVPKPEVDG